MFQRETAAPGPEAEDRGREAYPAGRLQVPDPGDKEESGSSKESATGKPGEKEQPNYIAVSYHVPTLHRLWAI